MIIDVALPVSLAFIMFTLGMGLTVADFRNVVRYPKAFTVGLINQMVALPLVGYAIIRIFSITGELAVGLMILSACPGGVTANVVTKLAKGDIALSVSFTAVISIATMITLPLITGFSVAHFMGAQAPEISILSLGLTMFLLATVPVVIGMTVHRKAPKFSRRFDRVGNRISTILFFFVVAVALITEWDVFVANLPILGPTLITLILVMLTIGYGSSRLFRLTEGQSSAVAIATGIQNVTMGITIGNIILPAGESLSAFALPSGVYGILMYLVCLPIVFVYSRLLLRRGATPGAVPAD